MASIITGMLLLGYVADKRGRSTGLKVTATLMFTGSLMLTASYMRKSSSQFVLYAAALALFGIGGGVGTCALDLQNLMQI